jgi:hypothetical protein
LTAIASASPDANTPAKLPVRTSEQMITPTQCKAVIAATLLALALPGCGSQLQWASPSAIAMNPSPAFKPPRNRAPASNQSPLDADEANITGSVRRDEATPEKRVNKQASCDRRQAVSAGMTRAQVYASCWGKPTSIDVSTTGPYKFELLVYEGYDYVYLEDGVVTSIQVSNR